MMQNTMFGEVSPNVNSSRNEIPDIKVLRERIPPHCFKPSLLRSFGYLLRDFLVASMLLFIAIRFIPTIPYPFLRAAAWILYGFFQGLVGTGLWILAHEAGHGAFSRSPYLNDLVGWFTHSVLLVPYFSWKFSHHRHHLFTGHMDKDTAFVPETRDSRWRKIQVPLLDFDDLEDIPAVQLLRLVLHQIFGWPLYLLFNATAGNNSLPKTANHNSLPRDACNMLRQSHFDPFSAVFRPSEAAYVLLSDIGVGLMLAALYWSWLTIGSINLMLVYGQPYVWVHHWLIAIAYLHITHTDIPHYGTNSWTFVKGALATVDRDFGCLGRHLFHGIIEYHVVHHLFPRIPFYHCEEATEAIRPLLGKLYHRDSSPFLLQLWMTFNTCKFVEYDAEQSGVARWAKKE